MNLTHSPSISRRTFMAVVADGLAAPLAAEAILEQRSRPGISTKRDGSN